MTRALSFLFASLLLTGCRSERPYTDHSKDPDLYAQDVKQLTLDALQRASRSREPADQIQTIVTEIEDQGANSRPTGSHKPTYDELLAAAKSLAEDCRKAGGKPPNLAARLDGLKKIAEKLPGTVQLDRDPGQTKQGRD